MSDLKEMFPDIHGDTIDDLLETNNGDVEKTIDALLDISQQSPKQPKLSFSGVQSLKKENVVESEKEKEFSSDGGTPIAPGNLAKFGVLVSCDNNASNINEKLKENCPICLCPFVDTEDENEDTLSTLISSNNTSSLEKYVFELSKCKHIFHINCTNGILSNQTDDSYLECPLCKSVSGTRIGTQPENGTMMTSKQGSRLPGFENTSVGMIVVTYNFRGGVQGPNHANPGRHYSAGSFPRTAYFPDNEQGRKIVQMLKIAFDRRLVFTVGRSVTTGADNVVTWNGIHHKTSIQGEPYGYPDPNYLKRVEHELKTFGVTESDLNGTCSNTVGIRTSSATKIGTQPIGGSMTITKDAETLPGFENDSDGMIVVTYMFSDGIQGPNHPNPGQMYSANSFPRTAYFPHNKQGLRIVNMLKVAFDRQCVFTVGRSATSGAHNVIIWSGIPHKTSKEGGVFGYPDPNYLDCVENDLKGLGISEKDFSSNPVVL